VGLQVVIWCTEDYHKNVLLHRAFLETKRKKQQKKVADPDPHCFGKLDADQNYNEKLDLDSHYSEKLDPDPY
jgi:hypothetical protein